MKPRIYRYAAWPLCLFLLAWIVLSSHGAILCMGDDGHAKVESVCDPCCNDSEPACFLDELEANHDHHDDCVNCTDLPLFQEVLKRRVLHPVVIEASPDIEFISSTINSCGERFLSEISRLSVSAFPPCAPDLKLGTTVLLC